MYLLGILPTAVASVLAFALLWLPVPRRRWAVLHLRRAAALRGGPPPPPTARLDRYLPWLAVHTAIGVPAGLLALYCLGNALLAAVVMPLWWLFPAADPPRLLIEVAVTGWASAVVLGAAQLAILAAVAAVLFPPLAALHARVTLAGLAPSAAERLADRVAELTRTRADVLDAHGAELRRIERDLHDGTQARLVAIAMRLAVARQALPDAPPAVADLLRQAHEGTEEAMTELREVVRTMYPPILADQGLAGALRAVAARGGVPADLDVGDLGAVPAAVEAVAYFAVAEALTNVAKHSRASRATVRVRRAGDRLLVEVRDDGAGGASEHGGTGLAGIRRRTEALDGRLTVTSPPGGPTVVGVELPCGS
ncbi:sensor histidine kinase [Phytohabitans flavus]